MVPLVSPPVLDVRLSELVRVASAEHIAAAPPWGSGWPHPVWGVRRSTPRQEVSVAEYVALTRHGGSRQSRLKGVISFEITTSSVGSQRVAAANFSSGQSTDVEKPA
jgi:hypothetical protein